MRNLVLHLQKLRLELTMEKIELGTQCLPKEVHSHHPCSKITHNRSNLEKIPSCENCKTVIHVYPKTSNLLLLVEDPSSARQSLQVWPGDKAKGSLAAKLH